MKRRYILALVSTVLIISVISYALLTTNGPIVRPAGIIAERQKHLLIFTLLLSFIVIIPVFVMTFLFAWRYRAENTAARYTPDWDGHRLLETIWWGIPCAIIFVLAIVTWQTSHAMDPFKPIDTSKRPLTIQVIALQWKWLFIYPGQGVATLNYVNIPEKQPIRFLITSDAPMNSFWLPALGGQIYAMAGMSTELNLEANHIGTFNGSSANISGEGFADMRFKAHAMSEHDFTDWTARMTDGTKPQLDSNAYQKLLQPASAKTATYQLAEHNLYNDVVMKYMIPGEKTPEASY